MSDTASAFHVLLQRGAPSDWQRVSALTGACAPRFPRAIVSKICRHGFGLIRLDFSEAEANDLAAKLTEAGYPALSLEARAVVQPPRPFTLLRLEFSPESLRIQVGASMQMQNVPWEALRILHVSCVQTTAKAFVHQSEDDSQFSEAVATAGLTALSIAAGAGPVGISGISALGTAASTPVGDSDDKKIVEAEVLLEFFTLDPLVRLRIRQSKFSYDVLGEQRQPTARANFARVLTEIKTRATQAACTGLFPLALGGRRIEPEKFGITESEHDQQLTALLTCEKIAGLPR